MPAHDAKPAKRPGVSREMLLRENLSLRWELGGLLAAIRSVERYIHQLGRPLPEYTNASTRCRRRR